MLKFSQQVSVLRGRGTPNRSALCALFFTATQVQAQTQEKLDATFSLSLEELTQVKIITPTRQIEHLSKTFSITYVIQATERRQLGACMLYDAIQHGLGMITSFENDSNSTRSLNLLHGNTFENEWHAAFKIFSCDDKGLELYVTQDAFGRSG